MAKTHMNTHYGHHRNTYEHAIWQKHIWQQSFTGIGPTGSTYCAGGGFTCRARDNSSIKVSHCYCCSACCRFLICCMHVQASAHVQQLATVQLGSQGHLSDLPDSPRNSQQENQNARICHMIPRSPFDRHERPQGRGRSKALW